jgi:eukaryotic-like serine/threonine-protein kinase
MRGVCAAVEAAHRRQLVHRDLKPENVFLVRGDLGETPKVLDFGIAKVLSDRASTLQLETGIGAIVGTPRYMAPEQLRGGSPEPSWDIWALALVAYEMLTGAHPFAALALGRPGAEPGASPAWGGEDGRLPPAWRPYFSRWFSVDPLLRPPDAREVFDELAQMLEQE